MRARGGRSVALGGPRRCVGFVWQHAKGIWRTRQSETEVQMQVRDTTIRVSEGHSQLVQHLPYRWVLTLLGADQPTCWVGKGKGSMFLDGLVKE